MLFSHVTGRRRKWASTKSVTAVYYIPNWSKDCRLIHCDELFRKWSRMSEGGDICTVSHIYYPFQTGTSGYNPTFTVFLRRGHLYTIPLLSVYNPTFTVFLRQGHQYTIPLFNTYNPIFTVFLRQGASVHNLTFYCVQSHIYCLLHAGACVNNPKFTGIFRLGRLYRLTFKTSTSVQTHSKGHHICTHSL